MADTWPSLSDDLELADRNQVWKFQASDNGLAKFLVGYSEYDLRTVSLKEVYIPTLACFDLEYWLAMDLDDADEEDLVALSKARLLKKYMQKLRYEIASGCHLLSR